MIPLPSDNPQRVGTAPVYRAYEKEPRFPVEKMRILLTNFLNCAVCPDCKSSLKILFSPFLEMNNPELDDAFPEAAQNIYCLVYYPSPLRKRPICKEDILLLKTICTQFRKAYPQSPLSSLFTSMTRVPFETGLEAPSQAKERDEEERLIQTSRSLALVYLQFTHLLNSSTGKDAENSEKGLKFSGSQFPKELLKLTPKAVKLIEQTQEIELIRLCCVLNLFALAHQERTTIKAGVKGAAAGVVISVLTGPGIVASAAITAASSYTAVKTSQILRGILTRSPPENLAYIELSDCVDYAFNDRSSGLQRFGGKDSDTYGYFRFKLGLEEDKKVFCYSEFHLQSDEPIAAPVMWELYERMRVALSSGLLTVDNLLKIIATLKTAQLPQKDNQPTPNILPIKTEVFLRALLPNHLRTRLAHNPVGQSLKVQPGREALLEHIVGNPILLKETWSQLVTVIPNLKFSKNAPEESSHG